ncbi:Ankyrin repeat-containing domain [Penicillium brevicompactum]
MTTSKSKDSESVNNIILAADQDQLDLVTVLLDQGVDPNTVDEIGTSALHNAAKQGHWEIARLLLEKKALPHVRDGNNATPIFLAAKGGHSQIVRLLLECGRHISDMSELESTRLVKVATLYGQAETVQLLLDFNAPTLAANGNETALHLAAMKGHHDVCDVLLKHDKNLTRSFWERMTGPSLQVYSKDYDGHIPFHYAVTKRHEKTIQVFLSNYPDLLAACDKDKIPFFFNPVTAGKIDIVRIFLENGVDIELKGRDGQGALHNAITTDRRGWVEGTKEMIHLLLEHGASVDAKDKYGCTPETFTNDPKVRMLLRNQAAARSKGDLSSSTPKVSAPPPEYRE